MRTFQQFAYGQIDAAGAPLVQRLWPRQPAWAVASISQQDSAFLAGLVMETRPRKLVEIGVASGWGSCVLLEALREIGMQSSELYGVDISDRFFYDATFATGQCVADVMPERQSQYRLLTGLTFGECASTIGGNVDFGFIDAHHMHPWAVLDLLALLPIAAPTTWVAMHDLNLSRKEDQEHRNRGPKYLFEAWDGDKVHSTEEPTMAGAIRLSGDPSAHLPLLLDVFYTPWELPVDDRALEAVFANLERAYGAAWSAKYRRAAEIGNYHVNKVHGPDIEQLRRDLTASRARGAGWIRRFVRERNG
jgi:predicted O-methyltransferase YrrM